MKIETLRVLKGAMDRIIKGGAFDPDNAGNELVAVGMAYNDLLAEIAKAEAEAEEKPAEKKPAAKRSPAKGDK